MRVTLSFSRVMSRLKMAGLARPAIKDDAVGTYDVRFSCLGSRIRPHFLLLSRTWFTSLAKQLQDLDAKPLFEESRGHIDNYSITMTKYHSWLLTTTFIIVQGLPLKFLDVMI